MAAPRKYPNELRERSQRMVAEAMTEDQALSLNAAVLRIGPRVGVNPDTLRGWIRCSDIDSGKAPGVTTADAATVRALQAEVRELKRANEILLAASSFFRTRARPPVAVVIAFIDGHRARFGVEPICRVLRAHGCGVSARTYRAAKIRPACARQLSDAAMTLEIVRVHDASRPVRRAQGPRPAAAGADRGRPLHRRAAHAGRR